MSEEDEGWMRMNGDDTIGEEVYKGSREHWKGDRDKKVKEKRKKLRRALREKSEQYHFYVNLTSSGALV